MYRLFLYISISLLSCNGNYKGRVTEICFENPPENVQEVTFDDMQKIKDMHGQVVKIAGVLHYSFEDVALYPTMYSNVSKALWLDLNFPEGTTDDLFKKIDGRKIIIVGKVDTSRKGHYGAYFATLISAYCIK